MAKTDSPGKLLTLLKSVIQNVENPWVVFLSYLQRSKRRKAKFYNGLEIEFSRDCVFKVYNACALLSEGYRICKLGEDFLIEGPGGVK